MQLRFALLAPVLLVSAVAFTASLSAQDKPADKPPQPAVDKSLPPVTAKTPPASGEAPTATAVLERSVAAIGGIDTWSKVKSMEVKGQLEMPGQGIKGPTNSFIAAPNKMLTVILLTGIGEIKTGFDGTVGWSADPISGPRLLQGGELEMISREADVLKDADPAKRWDKVELAGDGDFGGFSCWKLTATKGASQSTLWFEKETGLQRGLETIIESQLGKVPVSTVLMDYREFEGPFGKIKLPVRTEASQMGQKMVTTVESVTFDTVDEKVFELPTPIKALLEPEPAEEGETPAAAPAAPAAPTAPAAPAAPAAPTAPAAPAAPATPAKPTEPAQPKKEG
ncbi:MAG: hypothetical protein RLY21_2227 [Planctomycetota bacterium]|jgi:hypothetical protein